MEMRGHLFFVCYSVIYFILNYFFWVICGVFWSGSLCVCVCVCVFFFFFYNGESHAILFYFILFYFFGYVKIFCRRIVFIIFFSNDGFVLKLCVLLLLCIYMCVFVCVCLCVWREREREREKKSEICDGKKSQ